MSNLSAVLYGIHDLRLENTNVDELRDDEVLIEIAYVGICGSDVHYFEKGKINNFILEEPMILGHESSGIVVKRGKTVRNLNVGDRVAIEPGVPCRICDFCKKGRYNLCKDIKFCATPPVNGSLRKWYAHAADFCYKLPDWISLEEGALLEPLSVGVHACKRAGVGIGSTILVLGAGPVGLMTLIAAKAMGAKYVAMIDLCDYRLKTAEKLGADITYCMKASVSENKIIENIRDILFEEPDVTIDASGAESLVRLAIIITKRGGTIALIGMGPSDVKVPLGDVITKEIDIKGIFRYVNDYSDALNIIAKKRLDVKEIVSHIFSIEETLEAFETSRSRKSGSIKVMIKCN